MTRLFFPPDPADVDYDPAPRLKHWCNNPECSRCDEIAEAEAALPRSDPLAQQLVSDAEKWHRLYLESRTELHAERMQLRKRVTELSDQLLESQLALIDARREINRLSARLEAA